MYQALYRKYRPKTFDDVVGQEHITSAIKNEIACGRVSHAYLFTGSRGTGKTSCAKIIARAVCCPNQKDGNPCFECEICRDIEKDNLFDVVEMDAASNNSVDDVRLIKDDILTPPARAKYRVYIIDEVHMLSGSAFNALLKIMEEPPSYVIFILATTEVHKIPATILSRCQRFDFKRIPSDKISERILSVCQKEGIAIQKEAADLISRLADGGMRDALSTLDICRAYSEDITVDVVNKSMGLSSDEMLFSLADYVIDGDMVSAMEILGEMHSLSADFSRITTQLLEHYRLLMLAKSSRDALKGSCPSSQKEDRLVSQAEKYKMSHILYCIEILSETISNGYEQSVQKTILETALIKMCDPALDDSSKAVLARLDRLEAKLLSLSSGGFSLENSSSSKPKYENETAKRQEEISPKEIKLEQPKQIAKKPTEQINPAPAPAPNKNKGVDIKNATEFLEWDKVINILEKTNKALYGTLVTSRAFESNSFMLIDCENDFFFELMREDKYAKKCIKEALFRVTNKRYSLGPYKIIEEKEEASSQEENPFLDKLAQVAAENGVAVEIK